MKDYKTDCTHGVKHWHGHNNTYTKCRCRCDPCTRAAMDYNNKRVRNIAYGRWEPWVDATGTVRRIRALSAAGWSYPEMAKQVGMSDRVFGKLHLEAAKQGRVHRSTYECVRYLYEQLWHVTPTGRYALRSERNARRQGWAAPWDWEGVDIDDPDAQPAEPDTSPVLDEVAIAEAMRGRPVPLTRQEQAEAVARLTAAGYSAAEIAECLGTNKRAVTRQRARQREKDVA